MIVLPDEKGIAQCAAALQGGDLIGLPTETVYGLAGDATNDQAIAAIYATKNRPSFNPLIIHCADTDMAQRYAMFDSRADNLASIFWPGPLTLVLPGVDRPRVDTPRSAAPLSLLALSGLNTIAVRVPAHPAAQKLLQAFGRPVAAPSANPSGRLSPTTPVHVADFFKGCDQPKFILAGGKTETGLESTILDLTTGQATLLRYGAITREQIEDVIGMVSDGVQTDTPDAIKSPGQLLRHYAPRTRLRLNASTVTKNEALLTFGRDGFLSRYAKTALNLSESGDLTEAAANLFAYLHQLDQPDQFTTIAVMKIPNVGLGVAINDRLARAAS